MGNPTSRGYVNLSRGQEALLENKAVIGNNID
jgi:hypothetical protein